MTNTRCLCRYHVDDAGMHCLSVNCPVRGRKFPFKGSILSITEPHFYSSSRPGQEYYGGCARQIHGETLKCTPFM